MSHHRTKKQGPEETMLWGNSFLTLILTKPQTIHYGKQQDISINHKCQYPHSKEIITAGSEVWKKKRKHLLAIFNAFSRCSHLASTQAMRTYWTSLAALLTIPYPLCPSSRKSSLLSSMALVKAPGHDLILVCILKELLHQAVKLITTITPAPRIFPK